MSKYNFDIDQKELYEFGKPELKERTRNRLIQISESGMYYFGDGHFGIKEIISGLYIEKVWGYSDDSFNEYMEWAKSVINKKTNGKH